MQKKGRVAVKKKFLFIKKHWLILIILFVLPFSFEFVLVNTPDVSGFSNESWFSFLGSYIGSIITLIVMYITFDKSDEENKRIIELQRRQHQIDCQNKKIDDIIHVLLIDEYIFSNHETVCENIDRYIRDFQYIQLDTIKLKYADDEILRSVKLADKLLELQEKEIKIVRQLENEIPHVDSYDKSVEMIKKLLYYGCELSKLANSERQTVKVMYDEYLKRAYEVYFG